MSIRWYHLKTCGLALFLTGLLPLDLLAADKLRVVTTTTDLASIARYVGGDRAEVTCIATGKEDPHHVAAKPSYMMAARKADLWIRTGMSLEIGYERLILEGSRNPRILLGAPGHLDASVKVLRLEVPTQKIDRSMGDIHPQGNPHYLLDPLNGRIVAKTIAERMAQLRPTDADYWSQRLGAFQKEVDERMFGESLAREVGGSKLWVLLLNGELDSFLAGSDHPQLGGWLGAMKPYRGRKIITYHRNWSYFAHRFGLVVSMEVEPKPGIPPSPGRLTELIRRTKEEQLEVLLLAAWLVALLVTLGGLAVSAVWDLPTGSSLVSCFGVALILCAALPCVFRSRASGQAA